LVEEQEVVQPLTLLRISTETWKIQASTQKGHLK
jgi:hypothetical protein